MSKISRAPVKDPSQGDVDAMRAINAPKTPRGTLSASSQQNNQSSTCANDDKPLFVLGVTQTRSVNGPTLGPGGVRRSKANMSSAFGGGAIAAPTSAPADEAENSSAELFGGPATPHTKESIVRPNLFSLNPPLFSSSLPQGREQPDGSGGTADPSPQVKKKTHEYLPNVPQNLFGIPGQTLLFGGISKYEHTHPQKTSDGLFEQTNTSRKVPAVRVYAHETVDLGSDTIAITADKKHCGQKTFAVHKSLVMDRSAHLKSILLEDTDLKNITLDATDPQALALYIQHIYFGRLPTKSDIDNSDSPDEYSLLVKLYVLGTELQDNIATNAAVDALFAKALEGTELPSAEHISIIYSGTKGPCSARKLMVDIYTSMATNASMQDQIFLPEFMVDLALNLVACRSVLSKPAMPKKAAIYHED